MPRVLELDGYRGLGGLSLNDVPVCAPGKGEVRIQVQAFSLNWGELDLMEDNYSFSFDQFPARVGCEAVGIVEACGEGASQFSLGDQVATVPWLYGNNGVNGEFAVVPERFLTLTPKNMPLEQAAASWMQYMTAYYPMFEIAHLQSGDAALITAASSSAGLGAIELCKLTGVKAIVTSRTKEKTSFLMSAGADHVISTEDGYVVDQIMDATGGVGVNLAYDPVAGPLVSDYADALAADASIVIYGNLSGQDTILPEIAMTKANVKLVCYSLFNYVNDADQRKRGTDFVYKALASGKLAPQVDSVFTLDQWRKAYDTLKNGNERRGKIVVTTGL